MESERDEKKNERKIVFENTMFEDEGEVVEGGKSLFVLRFFICAEASNRDEIARRKQTEQLLSHRVPFKNIESEKEFYNLHKVSLTR